MVVEILDESQEWRIEMPNEDVCRDRPLEARDLTGNVRYEFRRSPWRDGWLGRRMQVCTPCDPKFPPTSTPAHDIERFTWHAVLAVAMSNGWNLFSIPVKTGVGE